MLECVINISEGRRAEVVEAIAAEAGANLLDIHRDPHHHRSVLTLAGPPDEVEASARAIAQATVERLTLTRHAGAHPRFGVLDVVPFVDLAPSDPPGGPTPTARAISARDRFAAWAGASLGLPCFLYGPERSLPEVRQRAFRDLAPDTGPPQPHPTAGATAVGARGLLVAYNLWLAEPDVQRARAVAAAIRGPALRALGLALDGRAQVSCNLIDPEAVGPAEAYDAVAAHASIHHAEVVGLVPAAVLNRTPPARWAELALDPALTIEARLAAKP